MEAHRFSRAKECAPVLLAHRKEYEKKMELVDVLSSDNEFLFRVISNIFRKEGVYNPYSVEDYTATIAPLSDDITVIRIGFPNPEEVPLCYRAYMFFSKNFEKSCYFTIEKTFGEDSNSAVLCSWTPDGGHLNFGSCSLDEKDSILACINTFM